MAKHFSVCRLFLFCALLTIPALHGQGLLGTILGSVKDAAGATVDGAVKVLNQSTGLTVTAQTNDAGLYQVPNLPIGTYTVSISKTGFQTEVHTQILV